MKVNNKKFQTYILDTPQTVLSRIAALFSTVPKYLYFPDGQLTQDDILSDKNVTVVNILGDIQNFSSENPIENLFSQILNKNSKINQIQDILIPYIVFNKTYESAGDNASFLLLVLQGDIDSKNLVKNVDVEDIWKNRLSYRKKLNKEIADNKAVSASEEERFKKFQSNVSDIQYTEFELEKVTFNFSLNIVNVSISELFNQIVLVPGVPIASYNGIYKIFKDFIPPIDNDWKRTHHDAILARICQKTDVATAKYSEYTNIMIVIEDDGTVKTSMELNLNQTGTFLSRTKLIERYISIFHGFDQVKHGDIIDEKVNGVFYIPQHDFDKFIFSDITMNEPLFSELTAIDESEKASKKKNSVYWHFDHITTGLVAANITGKIAEQGDAALRGKDIKNMFPFGSKYIRVKISSAKNVDVVTEFQKLFVRLLGVYDTNYNDILTFYKKYIPSFNKDIKVKKISNVPVLKLKNIAPEVFIKGYPPKCPKPPTIIDDNKAQEAIAQGQIVMRYPKSDDEGFIPRNYICTDKKAKFPALRDNPLSNRDLVRYLPCCYEKDHSQREGSIYRHYYFDEELADRDRQPQQDLIITNKFAPRDKFGILPREISKIFDIYDYQEDFRYVRKGVSNSKSSFLECVMEGMYEKTGVFNYIDEQDRKDFVSKTRKSLIKIATGCKQEMYDFKVSEIKQYILDQNRYFDPRYFISLLESMFGCNIYVFTRNNSTSGELLIPRYKQGYYKRSVSRPTVLIYEHIGSTSNHAKFPRCELIVKWQVNDSENIQYNYPFSSRIVKGIDDIYHKSIETYILDKKLVQTSFTIPRELPIIEQGIDSYGKCRSVTTRYKSQLVTLLTSPMQPYTVKESENLTIHKVPIEIAIDLAALLGMHVTRQFVSNGVTGQIQGTVDSVQVSIPVADSTPVKAIPEFASTNTYPVDMAFSSSDIELYNRYKKIARYVTEYMIWLFSSYINENENRLGMTSTEVSNFSTGRMVINSDFVYPDIDKTFSVDSPILSDGNLVVKSEETKKRLIYTLRVAIVRHRQKVLDYHKKTVIENYYVDITDFDQHQNQVILQGESSVSKWILEQKKNDTIYNTVIVSDIPYFFQNLDVSKNIYLAQNTNDLISAHHTAETWFNKGFNPGVASVKNPDYDATGKYTLYVYSDDGTLIEHKIDGNNIKHDIIIIGWLTTDDKPVYTTLLSLKK